MPSKDTQWLVGTLIAVAVALMLQASGFRGEIRAGFDGLRSDVGDMETNLAVWQERIMGVLTPGALWANGTRVQTGVPDLQAVVDVDRAVQAAVDPEAVQAAIDRAAQAVINEETVQAAINRVVLEEVALAVLAARRDLGEAAETAAPDGPNPDR